MALSQRRTDICTLSSASTRSLAAGAVTSPAWATGGSATPRGRRADPSPADPCRALGASASKAALVAAVRTRQAAIGRSCFSAAPPNLRVALQEARDRLGADPDRRGQLVLVDVLKAEVRRPRSRLGSAAASRRRASSELHVPDASGIRRLPPPSSSRIAWTSSP